MFYQTRYLAILGTAFGLATGCNTKKAPEAPVVAAEATKDESAASSADAEASASNEDLYQTDPYAEEVSASSSSSSSDSSSTTSTGSTTDVMGALNEVKAQAPAGPDEKAMFGKAALTGFMSVMPSLLQAGMSGQQVDLGRVGMVAAYNTGQNMMQQYDASSQQQAAAQQQALQSQGQSYGATGATNGY